MIKWKIILWQVHCNKAQERLDSHLIFRVTEDNYTLIPVITWIGTREKIFGQQGRMNNWESGMAHFIYGVGFTLAITELVSSCGGIHYIKNSNQQIMQMEWEKKFFGSTPWIFQDHMHTYFCCILISRKPRNSLQKCKSLTDMDAGKSTCPPTHVFNALCWTTLQQWPTSGTMRIKVEGPVPHSPFFGSYLEQTGVQLIFRFILGIWTVKADAHGSNTWSFHWKDHL